MAEPAIGLPIPNDVKMRADRGRGQMMRNAPKRRLCMKFEKGDSYWYLDSKGGLNVQPTATTADGGGKPPHRMRNSYNFIRPIIEDKVSAATQRIPGYDIAPTGTDPEQWAQASLSEKVAFYGYDQWRLRGKSIKAVKLAIGGGGSSFALPYFDPNVGPYTEVPGDEEGESTFVGQGELKVLILNGNEVYWEDGAEFEDSRFWCVERAMALESVQELDGFLGGVLAPDASTSDIPTDRRGENMVMVTDYFERPCPKYPEGRHLILANNRVIVHPEDYPLKDADGSVIDEPILLRLKYTYDPDTDDDFGLTWQLIDAQRTIQDCWNKLLEWKNRCLNPQMLAPVGSLMSRPNDVPGDVRYFKPVAGMTPQWETPPPVPQALFQMLDGMKTDMRDMAAYEDIHAESNVAATTVQQVISKSQARWQSFLGDLAEWHAHLMRRCLLLVARHYTEERLLLIRGHFGVEPIEAFRGSKIGQQINVAVLPNSLEYRSRQQIANQVLGYADRGWITPQQAMAAIDGGTAESLTQSFRLDEAKAARIIQKIRDGSVMQMPPKVVQDPMTGQPIETEWWMPDAFDSVAVWREVIGTWMKTSEFDRLDPGLQEVAKQIWEALQMQEAAAAQREQALQTAQAEGMGLQNAAKPQLGKPLPDQPQLPAGAPA
jgi:hypothetical protein